MQHIFHFLQSSYTQIVFHILLITWGSFVSLITIFGAMYKNENVSLTAWFFRRRHLLLFWFWTQTQRSEETRPKAEPEKENKIQWILLKWNFSNFPCWLEVLLYSPQKFFPNLSQCRIFKMSPIIMWTKLETFFKEITKLFLLFLLMGQFWNQQHFKIGINLEFFTPLYTHSKKSLNKCLKQY